MLCFWPLKDPERSSASVLSFGEIKILLDPGANDLLSEFLELDFIPDLILFSHSDVSHVGSFVHGFKHSGWHDVPIYATLPIFNMGRVTMSDCYKNIMDNTISTKDIDNAFDSIITLRYSQPISLSGKLNGISITAYNSGHSLGGTIWKITKDSENIVYCVNWNHSKDSHLNGSILYSNGTILDALIRPTILITDAINSNISIPSRKKRTEAFFDSIKNTLAQQGNVLIPTDAATRSLEFCWILDRYWKQHNLQYPIYFLSHTGNKAISYAQSMIEWMSDSIISEYGSSGSVFEFTYVKVITNEFQFLSMVSGPKVILATSSNMDCGFSQKIFLDSIAKDSKNLVILSQKSIYYENSLSKDLLDRWNLAIEHSDQLIPPAVILNFNRTVTIRTSVPLVGSELEKYQEKEKLRREKEAAKLIMELQNRDLFDSSDSDLNDDSNDRKTHFRNDSMIAKGSASLLTSGVHDLYLQTNEIRKMSPRFKMFPTLEKRRRFDDFGEIIIPEKFFRIIEEDLEFNANNELNKSINTMTKKRKWAGISNNIQNGNIDKDINVPSKTIITEEKILIKCSVRYIDMEGLHDGKSLKTIIPMVNPRKLVLINSTQEAKDNMMATCRSLTSFTNDIYSPLQGEVLKIGIKLNSYNLKLSDNIINTLRWKKLGDYNVSHVIGKLKLSADFTETNLPILEILSTHSNIRNIPQSHPLFVGDVKLTQVKQLLQDQGHVAELIGEGVLLCDGLVTVRKIGGGKVILEGGVSQEFYDVRKIVYDSIVEFL
ncbi:unnamed protein product [Pneumocystis jirovecii]|uniref:Cleavage and polyadenylation specificity factor subunit 2 n=1 Tax=Pneumocystis jirovecii TaxID=42068 RepID=L0PBP4_PNEJI|nr:unnamed protein product [Pneumocystis jirovecii]CCJ29045.1 unnamed protein product [Pneumocystis jirovecii]